MAMSQCTKESIWLKHLMEDVGCVQEDATKIISDNQGFMEFSKNPTNHELSKNINEQHHLFKRILKTKLWS